MTVRLSAPSKTFLTGEYAVLSGGPALIVNTQPRFELIAEQGTFEVRGIGKSSPAGLWLRQREPLLENWRIEFRDPHQGKGGLGASSAQFLLLHSFTTVLQRDFKDLSIDPEALWNDYQLLTAGSGSGADVLAQACGGVARVDLKQMITEAEEWPYPEIGFMVLRTGRKLATHEHLKTLDRKASEPLVNLSRTAFESFDVDPSERFLVYVYQYAKALRELGLQAPATLSLLETFEKQEWSLVAKGCGAFGADTVIIFYPSERRKEALMFAQRQGVELLATETDLSSGLEISL